jgi:phospholipid/cholesterol/gamma-HCH transport system substrate-binding protein
VFADATGLRVNSDVKIGGVAGGRVVSMTLDPHDQAVVTLSIDPNAAPIGRGATATIRPANLLGEYYVDLQPGDVVNHPVPSGVTLPATATGSSVGLDQVLDTLDATTRDRLAILINETGIAFGSSGPQFAATLASLPPALDQARQVLGQLNGDNRNIRSMISQGNAVLSAIDTRHRDLQDLVSTAAGALSTTAAHQASLGRTLAAAPAALVALHSTLVNLGAASEQLRPAAQALLATSPPLSGTLAALPGFTSAASATLRSLRDVSPALTRLGQLGTPTVRQIQPVAARLHGYLEELDPVLNTLDQGGVTDTLMRWMYNWASVTSTRDALGHLFRVTVAPNAALVSEALGSLTGATSSRHRHAARPQPTAAAPRPGQTPRVPSTTSPRLPGIGAAVTKLRQTIGNLVQVAQRTTGAVGHAVSGVLNKLGGSSTQPAPGQPPQPPEPSLGGLLNYLLKP